MDIKINKDIATEYPDDTYKGFSVKQILCIVTAAGLGMGIVLVLYYIVGLNIHVAVYSAFPVAAPIILLGFIRYKGMFLMEALKEWVRLQDQPVMVYEACENLYDLEMDTGFLEAYQTVSRKSPKKKKDADRRNKGGRK